MGTIRNEIVIVQHWNKEEAEKLRESAVEAFQKTADTLRGTYYEKFDVNKQMITPVLESFINQEYTFFINGDCSKLRWEESIEFKKTRDKWVEDHRSDASYIVVVNIGEDFPPRIEWSNYSEDEEEDE